MEVSVHIVSRTAVAQAQLIYYMPTIGWHALNFPQKVHALIRIDLTLLHTQKQVREAYLCARDTGSFKILGGTDVYREKCWEREFEQNICKLYMIGLGW